MSALGAIETPIAAADARCAAKADAARGERRLRVVRESMPVTLTRASDGSVHGAQPRSSSSREAAALAGPAATSILVGTVVGRRGQRSVPAGARGSQTQLRLTRRGRIVVAALVVALLSTAVLLLTALVSGRAQATNHGQPGAGYQGLHQVVVRSGQTLWSIAVAADPSADPRDVVQEIMTANALGSPSITAGQLLWVP